MRVLRSAAAWLSTAGRLLTIGAVGATSLAVYGLGRAGLVLVRDPEARRRRVARWRGRVLRRALTTLGATFVKVGQILSTRPDLLAPELVDELRRLQDRMAPFPFAEVARALEADLGAPVMARFAELDVTPVAAASVAQVHRGRLRDGTVVAIKVLRPGVRRQIERDGAVLLALARLAMLHPMGRLSDPVAHVRELVQGILEQTDLAREADSYETFARNFSGVNGVVFPRVYREHSGPHVLTMTYLEGRKIDELPPTARDDAADLVRNSFFKMCFEDGFVHADLHPGNLLVTAEGDLVILDAGLVKRFGDGFLDEFLSFTRCLVLGTPRDFVDHFRRFHPYLVDADWDAVERDIGQLMERFARQSAAALETSDFSNEVFALFRKHHIRPVPEITMVLVGSLTSEGIGKMLSPARSQFEDIAHYVMGVYLRRMAATAVEPEAVIPTAQGR